MPAGETTESKHGVVEHKKCESTEEGAKCGRPATMTCANCGTPICEFHSKHGRFCSDECFQAARLAGWGVDKKEEEEKEYLSALQVGGILIVVITVIVGALAYFGILDPNIIIAMVPQAIRDLVPLP
jgi:hypothetical protein